MTLPPFPCCRLLQPELIRGDVPCVSCYDPMIQDDFFSIHRTDAMSLPRFSILKLMVVVGIVAINLASTQLWSPSSDPSLLSGRFLTSIALQVGILCVIRSRRTRISPFWSGFVAFGLAAAITSIYIDFINTESKLFDLMDLYLFHTFKFLDRTFYYKIRINYPVAGDLAHEVVGFLPHLLIAIVGGCLTSLAIRLWDRRCDPVSLGSATS